MKVWDNPLNAFVAEASSRKALGFNPKKNLKCGGKTKRAKERFKKKQDRKIRNKVSTKYSFYNSIND